MARGRPGWASRSETFGTYHTAFAVGAWKTARARGNAGRTIPPPARTLHRGVHRPQQIRSHTPYQGEKSSA